MVSDAPHMLVLNKIITLNTIDLWVMGIQWGFDKGIRSHFYYHTIYYSFSHLSNGIFNPFLYYLIILLTIKLIITYDKNNISVY